MSPRTVPGTGCAMPRAQGGQGSHHPLVHAIHWHEFGMPMATWGTPIFTARCEPQEVAPVLNLAQGRQEYAQNLARAMPYAALIFTR